MVKADLILGLCDRFHCTPDVAAELDIEAQQLIAIEQLAYPERYPEPKD